MTVTLAAVPENGWAAVPTHSEDAVLLARWEAAQRLEGQRPNSIATRSRVLRHVAKHLAGRGLLSASRADLEAFLGRPGLAPKSRKAYRAHLRTFYGWAVEEGVLQVDPAARIRPVRVPKAVPRPISHAELETALAAAHPRMRAWLLLMALGGLRACEVALLRPEDVRDGRLFLRETKGGGEALVPAHAAIVEALSRLRVENGLWWSCTAAQVSTSVAAYLRSVGVDATGHRLRHYAATAWYEASGRDLLTTARLLRHASVATTEVYARIGDDRPAQVVQAVTVPLEPSGAVTTEDATYSL